MEYRGLKKQDAVVVLASRQYTSWLQDDKFMAALLQPFNNGRELNVLAAVVDGLHPLRAFGEIPQGFSFFHGPKDSVMPTLWQEENIGAQPPSNAKLNAAIKFLFGGKSGHLACTFPLANTIFQNGLLSTLLASRWRINETGGLDLVELKERQAQEVNISNIPEGNMPEGSVRKNSVEAPLFPITPPRMIASGLGNIIRQVEIFGKETPASGELETAVQELLDRRTEEGHELPPGPLGVWGVVCPPGEHQDSCLGYLKDWFANTIKVQTAGDEWRSALEMKESLKWLIKRGARVYKIQSGGGGWGKKAGLLSLDPETKYSASSEEEDLDIFIRSFANRRFGDADGVVGPGSYIQYFVTPPSSAKPKMPPGDVSQFTDCFGMTDDAQLEASSLNPGPTEWKSVRQQFGAVTSHGLFVEYRPRPSPGMETKLDVPGSWIGHMALPHGQRWKNSQLPLLNMAANKETPSKIGVVSIGDMGVGIAKLLIAKGFQVATNCKGRSDDTLQRARDANVELVDSDADLASQCAAILSVVPPRDAEATADRIIDALAGSSRETPLYFIDMNAVAPSTCKSIASSFARARSPARFVDACIIGAPPRLKSAPNAGTNVSASGPQTGSGDDDPDAWYVPGMPMSGPHKLADLSLPATDAAFGARLSAVLGGNHISEEIGAASGLKMCFASMSKGFTAIATQAFTSAHRMGVLDHLRDELATRLPGHLEFAEKGVVTMPPKAYRWVREMEEISKTHAEEGGFGPELFVGAAGVYRSVAEDSPLGQEKIGKRKRGTTVEDVAVALVEGFEKKKKKTD
ncbi:hypothetical protein CORC01_05785 [Colletotrichum orchidophilum]|uniref:Phosphogluconate dehydrogenase NAD-binding putative C-terminal domain-containing protein n=1 Tax=Colletotrichum orchidophilum TaxID=1209926 RepID=A0A1G4BBV8_9PEZI|nr:uncharacterized protein CORC01_05785 [Colletotrichum orchidophilum]OHE98889.1 hypothetical protein CORC01_05785 [Colletotrichum orchidophilum]